MSIARRWMQLAVASAVGLAAPVLIGTARAQDKPAGEPARPQGAEVKKDEKKVEPPKARIAVFRLAGPVKETPTEEVFNFGGETGEALLRLVERLDKAAGDPAVKAVVVVFDGATVGPAQVGELRQAFDRVKSAGKELIGHADTISTLGQYVLLSDVGRLSVVPTADIWATGLYGETPYLRGMLEKLGVKPDFLTCGDYKSAAEMFMREGPSKEAESMQNWLLDSLYDTQIARIAAGRKVAPELVKAWIDSGPRSAEKAKELGMLDVVEHRQDLEGYLEKKYGEGVVFDRKYGKKAEPKLDASSPFGLFKFWGELLGASKPVGKKKPAIGVVYVDGPIVLNADGGMALFQDESAASTAIRKALDEAAADDAIKAVVLRVDSPGGSALASEIILDATDRVKARKPFTVSMGNVAGSGGYYVACAADTVFADETTITGSIGVVGGKLATGGLYDKVGVKFKESRRGQNSGMLSSAAVFTPAERIKMQSWMDEIYGVFKGHVAAIRGGKLKKPLDELAGGRVYTGKQALELGLVDRLGTLHDAVRFAADAAKLTEYDVRVVPRPRSALERLLDESSGDDDRKGIHVPVAAATRPFLIGQALPLVQAFDPARAAVVLDAVRRLELIHREGVVLMAPELGLGR